MALRCLQLLRPPHPSLHRSYSPISSPIVSISDAAWRRLNGSSPSFRLLCSTSDQPQSTQVKHEGVKHCSQKSIVGDLLDYLNESWTQFHATAEAKRQLLAAGFELLNENDDWDLQPGGRYFFTRNMSCLIAFSIGLKYKVGNGFHIIAAHTDSPCLKLKPRSASSKSGYLTVNVQTYGGGLWYTWFDRDLSLAGRVILRDGNGSFLHRLVRVKRPLLRVPTLAIHLDRTVNSDGFKPNLETHLVPLLATKNEESQTKSQEKTNSNKSPQHHSLLLNVGSNSMQGAGAPTMFQAMRRIVDNLVHQSMGEAAFERAIRSSFLVSADMAHGVHPNFSDKHEEHHRPGLQKGLVIKHNANQRYATSAVTAFLFKQVAQIHDLPVQEFVVRNDMGCGSTIGPILASGVGIRTVDCGIPQLSMHSVREICGKEDIDNAYRIFSSFFDNFSEIDKKLSVDF
ncbi:Zn-dependent exopeptidases superfamily protein isoform X3 [Carex rostrata]